MASRLSYLRGVPGWVRIPPFATASRLSSSHDVTNNQRSYAARGIQASMTVEGALGRIAHRLTAGVRLHADEVRRNHLPRGYLMQDGNLLWDELTRGPKVRNRADTTATAVFVSEELAWRDFALTLGVRHEDISGEFEDLRHDRDRESGQEATTPGIGLHWQATDTLGLVAGAYRGFSPAGPGASAEPEEAVNVEYGLRYLRGATGLELVGFFSDHDNLVGRCRVSDFGCEPGHEFNGGHVEVTGAELVGTLALQPAPSLDVDVELAYTYTESAFQDSFLSSFSQWGLVREGDELPYLPRHRGHLRITLARGAWEWSAAVQAQSRTREQPGSGAIADRLYADRLTTLDLAATWRIRESTWLHAMVGNATDEVAIVSHRPFGARPNRPRWFTLRVQQHF